MAATNRRTSLYPSVLENYRCVNWVYLVILVELTPYRAMTYPYVMAALSVYGAGSLAEPASYLGVSCSRPLTPATTVYCDRGC